MRSGVSPRGAIAAAAAALFLISSPPVLWPQKMVLQRFSSQNPDPQLEEVLYLATGAALVQAGLSTTREGDTEDYLLLTRYDYRDAGTEIRYTLLHAPAPSDKLADMTVDVRVDGGLDAQVAAAVIRLLRQAAIEPVPSSEARIEGLLPDAPAAAAEASSRSGEASAAAPPGAAAPAAAAAGNAPEPLAVKASDASIMKFDSSISAAGMLFFGAVAEFLHYGVGTLVFAGVTWPHASWSMTLGAELSAVRALNDARVTGGPLSLTTAGLRAQIGTGTSSPYRVAVGVSGGAAAIIVEGTGEPLSKLAPYADAAVQATLPIGGSMSFGGEARFLAVFANDVLILAAAPALILRIEL